MTAAFIIADLFCHNRYIIVLSDSISIAWPLWACKAAAADATDAADAGAAGAAAARADAVCAATAAWDDDARTASASPLIIW